MKKSANTDQDWASELFPIRILAERTSVGTSTLRAWERRYGLLKPQRTPKGHRLYGESDVKKVSKILALLDDGHALPSIAEILSANESVNSLPDSGLADKTEKLSSVWEAFIHSTIDAVGDFNIERIDAIFNEASSLYPIDMVTDKLIQPTITQLGTAWKHHPDTGVAEEHFYSSWLKNRLGARFHHAYSQAKGSRIICACVPGSYHEIGLMLFALSALSRGYRVLYFGADLPLDQLQHITQRSAAKAIVLSAHTSDEQNLEQQLISTLADIDTPVFLGGSANLIDNHAFEKAGGILLGTNISVAMKVFESHVAAYPSAEK